MGPVVVTLIGLTIAPLSAVDWYGDPLPAGALARCGTVRWRVPGFAQAVAYSPDGKTLAAASNNFPLVLLFDAATGKELRRFQCGVGLPRALAFSPDGKWLAARGYGAVCVFETARAGRGTVVPSGDSDEPATALAWSPDGRVIHFTERPPRIGRWDVTVGKPLPPFTADPSGGDCLACSPDGRRLAVGFSDLTVQILDASDGTVRARINQLDDPSFQAILDRMTITSVAYTPDGRRLALTAPPAEGIRVYDAATGQRVAWFKHDKVAVSQVVISRDGQRLVGVAEGERILVWDFGTEKLLHDLTPGRELSSVAVSPDGSTLAAAQVGGAVRFWDLGTGREKWAADAHSDSPFTVAWSPDGKLLATGGDDRIVRTWEPATGRPGHALAGHEARVRAVAFSPDGKVLASAASDFTLRLWDPNAGRAVGMRSWESEQVSALAFSPCGDLAAALEGGGAGRVTVWDGWSGRELLSFGTGKPPEGLTYAPDGKTLAVLTRSPSRVRTWPANAPGRESQLIELLGIRGQQIAFRPDGRLLAVLGYRPTIELWDPIDRTFVRRIEWNPGGPLLAGTLLARFAWSPDGRLLAVAGPDAAVRVWEALTRGLVLRLDGHRGPVHDVAFAPDGRRLASVSHDTTALVWGLDPLPTRDPTDAATLWDRLASADAAEAYRAAHGLAAVPATAVPLLRERLAARPDPEQIARLIADLDSPKFAERDRATRELSRLDSEAALRALLAGSPSIEARRRAESLLKRLREEGPAPEVARVFRAMAVLERIGSPEARKALEELSRGDTTAVVTREARAAVERLRLAKEARP